jgi:hypothetical protein
MSSGPFFAYHDAARWSEAVRLMGGEKELIVVATSAATTASTA